jgi:hypothetical protein
MIFARIGHGSCYYCWNEIFAGVYLIIPRDIYSVAQWVKTVFWFSIVVFCTSQGAHYESTYNVNYKGEVGTQYLGFREKNSFYCPVSDKGSENCH